MQLLAIFGTFCCIIISYVFLNKRRFKRLERSNGCEPARKYPHRDPFGLDVFIQTGKMFQNDTCFPTWLGNFSTYGNTFITKLFGKITVHSCEPENLQYVYSTNSKDWGIFARQPVFEEFMGKGAMTTDGKEWEHWRSLLKPSFSRNALKDQPMYSHYVEKMLAQVPGDGTTFNLQELVSHLYLDTASQFLFGDTFGFLSEAPTEDAVTYLESQKYVVGVAGLRMALGPMQMFHHDPNFGVRVKSVHRVIDKYIDRIYEGKETPTHGSGSFEGKFSMLKSMTEQTSNRKDIRNNIIQAFMASLDTTGFLISNVFWQLARHPELWKELRQAVSETFRTAEDVTFDEATKIKIVSNVLNETLRMYPVFPYMMRNAFKDTTIPTGGGESGKGPIYVPAGSDFSFNFAALHRRKDIYGPDADTWIPERWNDLQGKLKPWHYAPFGGGQRACLGKNKALAEASYFICRMAQEFEFIEPRDDRPWKGHVTVTACNAYGCVVSLQRAQKVA